MNIPFFEIKERKFPDNPQKTVLADFFEKEKEQFESLPSSTLDLLKFCLNQLLEENVLTSEILERGKGAPAIWVSISEYSFHCGINKESSAEVRDFLKTLERDIQKLIGVSFVGKSFLKDGELMDVLMHVISLWSTCRQEPDYFCFKFTECFLAEIFFGGAEKAFQ